MRKLVTAIAIVSIGLLIGVPFAPGAWGATAETAQNDAAARLEGKVFSGELVPAGKKTGDKDELIFKSGKFRSTACDAHGFGEASYAASLKDGKIAFQAEALSAQDGMMKWEGVVKGDSLEGTAVWIKEGQAPVTHHFVGKLKK